MRLIPLLVLASSLLVSAAALVIPGLGKGSSASLMDLNLSLQSKALVAKHSALPGHDNLLEGRAKKGGGPPKKVSTITFTDHARERLDALNLHGKDRKKVEKWHITQTEKEMKRVGATHGQINHLAHAVGSTDPNIHITAAFQKQRNTQHGPVMDTVLATWNNRRVRNHHVYVSDKDKAKGRQALPPAYVNAVTAQHHAEGRAGPVQFR